MTMSVAHRGEPVAHRENTLAAFEAAVSQGADMIELDCRMTSDRNVVVLHDRTLGRLWGVPLAVSRLTLAELARVGDGALKVPGLSEVLDAVDIPVMVDVAEPQVMEAVLDEVIGARALARCVFVGHLQGLRWLRGQRADARIGLTWSRRHPPSVTLLDELQPEFFNPRWDLLDKRVIDAMHRRACGVSAWTVDDPLTMAHLIEEGVDAVITNHISALVELLRARRAGAQS